MAGRKRKSPRVQMQESLVREALKSDSSLRPAVQDGLGAVKDLDRDHIDEGLRSAFSDSLDIDEALRKGNEQENRWDYLLGYSPSKTLIALEPHPATMDEIQVVIQKRKAARDMLRRHLVDGAAIHAWLWVASGKNQFADIERVRRSLDQNGITYVGRRVLARHLPATVPSTKGGSR